MFEIGLITAFYTKSLWKGISALESYCYVKPQQQSLFTVFHIC